MKRRIVYAFLAIGLIVAGYFYYQNSYVAIRPLRFENFEYFVVYKGDDQFYANMEKVLTYYHESYKKDATGRLLVKRKLNRDEELIWNYTTKALDTAEVKRYDQEIEKANSR